MRDGTGTLKGKVKDIKNDPWMDSLSDVFVAAVWQMFIR